MLFFGGRLSPEAGKIAKKTERKDEFTAFFKHKKEIYDIIFNI